MILRQGSSGDAVRTLQENLNKQGANIEVDGVYGSLTVAAVKAYQTKSGYTVDGIAGSQTLGGLGLSSLTDSGKTDYTEDEATRFNGLPGEPEIWKAGGLWYAVYFVPGTEPPVPMLYSIPTTEDLKSFFGDKSVKADRQISGAEMVATGATRWGSTDEIPAQGGSPWAGFMERMDRIKETQPWMEDPEVFGVFAAAWLEERQPEQWELESTEWWQSKNERQQEWMWLSARSPEEATSLWQSSYINVFNAFQSVGIMEPDDLLVSYMAKRYVQGDWNKEYLNEQMQRIFGGSSAFGLDIDLSNYLKKHKISVESPTVKLTLVREEFNKWLGPSFAPSEKDLQRWAGILRQDPEAGLDTLTEHLRSQRMALFPDYKDPMLTYDDIASPWRTFHQRSWGIENVDETTTTFQKLLKLNDTTEGGKLLRREGLKQGVEKIEDEAVSDLGNEVSQVREAV